MISIVAIFLPCYPAPSICQAECRPTRVVIRHPDEAAVRNHNLPGLSQRCPGRVLDDPYRAVKGRMGYTVVKRRRLLIWDVHDDWIEPKFTSLQ